MIERLVMGARVVMDERGAARSRDHGQGRGAMPGQRGLRPGPGGPEARGLPGSQGPTLPLGRPALHSFAMRFLLPLLALGALCAAALPAQLQHAPEPRQIGGHTVVPIDIQSLDASLRFDFKGQRARARAVLKFKAGVQDGKAVFDLRQEAITAASLDGEKLDPSKLITQDFGRSSGTMVILDLPLKAGTAHQLELEYEVGSPKVPKPLPPKYTAEGVTWDTWASDLNPGRYLEQWFPTNLLYDQFKFDLELQVQGLGGDQKHEVVTNAEIEQLAPAHWKLSFPAHFTAFSPMVVLIPSVLVERSQKLVKLKNGQQITVDVCRPLRIRNRRSSLANFHSETAKALEDFTRHMGPWPHGKRCTIFEYSGGRSMEYDGATTTAFGALRHELFHSYFGRGLKPASQNGGWWDEAFTVYFLGHLRALERPDRAGRGRRMRGGRFAGRIALSPADPWNRVTPGASYSTGAWFFAEVGKVIGTDTLHKTMAGLVKEHSPNPISTAQLQARLEKVAGAKAAQVRDLFDFVVYAKKPVVRFTTAMGAFTVELERAAAPKTVANFLRYVDAGHYNGGRFHRAVREDNQARSDHPIQVVQASVRRGKKGFDPIELESTRRTRLSHSAGTISMARGKPDSATSDFFICLSDAPSLDHGGARNQDGQGFAAFGKVIEGMDVLRKIHAAKTKGERLTPPVTIEKAIRVR